MSIPSKPARRTPSPFHLILQFHILFHRRTIHNFSPGVFFQRNLLYHDEPYPPISLFLLFLHSAEDSTVGNIKEYRCLYFFFRST